jgi:hypothetical protein
MTNTPERPAPVSLADQAYMIDCLVKHCTMSDGSIAGETWHLFRKEDVEALAALRDRLDRMAPHEVRIRRLVTGR